MTKKGKSSKKSGKAKISFDEEVVTRDNAKTLIIEEKPIQQTNGNEPQLKAAKKPKRKKQETESEDQQTVPKKRSKVATEPENDSVPEGEPTTETPTKPPNKESNRSRKRQKYAKLLEEKKLKTELDLQQKALNYLSKWKHSRSEWKFEKLRQIWLQQNYLDTSKIPNEFWEILVDYFSGSKGQSKQAILDGAVKFIENDENVDEEKRDEDYDAKSKRAKDIVQNLE